MFTAYPTYNPYRSLRLSTPHLKGEDVYALQTALIEAGFALPQFGADGDLGSETDKAIRAAQTRANLTVDGVAGPKTQTALAEAISAPVTTKYRLPKGALYGQEQTESNFILGNYSPQRDDGTYDAGLCQRNTKFTNPKDGFDAAQSVDRLGAQIREYFDMYTGITDTRRRWALAQGSWNAPAFANYIAKEEGATGIRSVNTLRPSAAQRQTLEVYIASASAYLQI